MTLIFCLDAPYWGIRKALEGDPLGKKPISPWVVAGFILGVVFLWIGLTVYFQLRSPPYTRPVVETKEGVQSNIFKNNPELWSLPIQFGSSIQDVHAVFGPPDDVIDADSIDSLANHLTQPEQATGMAQRYRDQATQWRNETPGKRIERYNVINCTFEYDYGKLTQCNFFNQGILSDRGLYTGKLIRDFSLSDNRASMLEKLGSPTNLTPGEIPMSNANLLMPAPGYFSVYSWDFGKFMAIITVRDAPEKADTKVILPTDSISDVYLFPHQGAKAAASAPSGSAGN
jgi:hypothetical protein